MPTHGDTLETPKTGKVTEMFPYEMPFRASRAIASFLIALFAVLLTAAIVFDFPETVNAPFVLVPESGTDPIQSPYDGVIEEVHASTKRLVAAGEILFSIRSPRIQDLYAQQRTLEEEVEAIARRRQAAVDAYEVQKAIQAAEVSQRQKELEYRRSYLAVYRDVLSRFEKLGEQGLTSSVDLLSHRLGKAEAERDAALAQEQLNTARLDETNAEALHQQMLSGLDSESKKAAVQIENLQAQLAHAEGDIVHVRAPYDGAILSIARKRQGDVVGVGQELCQIAAADAPPRAQLRVPERGMARLDAGQPAKLLFEAFPYQRYGVVNARLSWLSPAAIEEEGEPIFLAQAVPERLEIGEAQARRDLRVGMKGEARIQVGRRTLIEYAFEPLRQLRENMRNPEADATDSSDWWAPIRDGAVELVDTLRQ